MIYIFWLNTASGNIYKLDKIKEKLSIGDLIRYDSFKRQEDQLNFLSGRYLVYLFLQKYFRNSFSLRDIWIDKNKRPVISEKFSFSISHSEGFVAVAFSSVENCKIGLDIELVIDVEPEDYLIAFSDEEKAFLQYSSKGKTEAFFKMWTKKESFLKATGTGFLMDPTQVPVLQDHVSWESKIFHFKNPELNEHLSVSLCSNFLADVNVQKILLS